MSASPLPKTVRRCPHSTLLRFMRLNLIEDYETDDSKNSLCRDTTALRNAGVVKLDLLYFDRHEPGAPETA